MGTASIIRINQLLFIYLSYSIVERRKYTARVTYYLREMEKFDNRFWELDKN